MRPVVEARPALDNCSAHGEQDKNNEADRTNDAIVEDARLRTQGVYRAETVLNFSIIAQQHRSRKPSTRRTTT
jgi:hypothetical protein